MSYALDPEDLGDGTEDVEVTITATLADGYGWGTLGAGWTWVDVTHATFTVTCSRQLRRGRPGGASRAPGRVCRRGPVGPVPPLVETDGITYTAVPPGPTGPVRR